MKHIGFYPVVLFGSMFLAVLFSYEPSASFRFLLYHIAAALCVLVTVSAVRGAEDLKRLAAGGGVCVLVSSLYGVYQRIQGVEVNVSYVDLDVNAGMPGRVQSYFDNPNTFAEVLILLLPLGAGADPLLQAARLPPGGLRRLRRGRAGPGHDLLPGQLGGHAPAPWWCWCFCGSPS